MLEVVDYSNRRGAMVRLLPQIHTLLAEQAQANEAGPPPPGNFIIWKQKMHKALVDITRRWLFATDGERLAGFMFYRMGEGSAVYIDDLLIAGAYQNERAVFALLTDKFAQDSAVKASALIFAGERIKIEESKALLAAVGIREQYPDGYQPLGDIKAALGALKLRYADTRQTGAPPANQRNAGVG